MIKLFIEGGPLFMGVLTLIALAMISWSVIVSRKLSALNSGEFSETRQKISYIKSIGIFAMVVGFLGQLIGLYDAFIAIEQMGTVSPGVLAGGLKVSSITTLYGIIIFLISYVIWFLIDFRSTHKKAT